MTTVLVAALCSYLFLRALIPIFRRILLDRPNKRSSHHQPTPRGGGVSIVVISSLCSIKAIIGGESETVIVLSLLATPLAIIGLIDDRLNLSAASRYFFQLLTAILMLSVSPLVVILVLNWSHSVLFLSFILTLAAIAITALINFANFMDGIDGLLAGCMAVIISALAISLHASWPLYALVGSILGFLCLNWNPAQVFMGDVGSTFLGALFAGLVLQASSWPVLISYVLVATPLLGDASLCLIRRLLAGHRVSQPHRLHLFQRLHQAGWPQSRVSLTYISATALLAVAMLTGGLPLVLGLACLQLYLGIWLDRHVAIPFAMASNNFH